MIIGSRGSKLALWQAEHIRSLLLAEGIDASVRIIHTTGDKITDVPLARLGAQTSTKGLFTKEIEEALLAGEIDLAVHSMKDMPTELPPGLVIAAVPVREDARDALISRWPLAELPSGAKVGTSALRREAQLRAIRPDLRIESLRGNVDTRLRKFDEGQFDAILLAAAGLRRLGWQDRITEYISIGTVCPAVGQGALAIETREGDSRFRFLDDPGTRAAVELEREFLRAMGGGCQVPMGCHVRDGRLDCAVAEPDGSRLRRFSSDGERLVERALEAVR
jgi:hydroxymethylbilane synthase